MSFLQFFKVLRSDLSGANQLFFDISNLCQHLLLHVSLLLNLGQQTSLLSLDSLDFGR